MPKTRKRGSMKIYVIVHSGCDADRGIFTDPFVEGAFSEELEAAEELERLISEEKERLDLSRFDTEEQDETHWEIYADGYAAALFSRLEIVETELRA